jgi:hypothetical protein
MLFKMLFKLAQQRERSETIKNKKGESILTHSPLRISRENQWHGKTPGASYPNAPTAST